MLALLQDTLLTLPSPSLPCERERNNFRLFPSPSCCVDPLPFSKTLLHLTCAIRQFNLFCWGWCCYGATTHTRVLSRRTSATLTWSMEVSRWFGKSNLKVKYSSRFHCCGLCDSQGNRAQPGISALGFWVFPQADCSHMILVEKLTLGFKVNSIEVIMLCSVTHLLMLTLSHYSE